MYINNISLKLNTNKYNYNNYNENRKQIESSKNFALTKPSYPYYSYINFQSKKEYSSQKIDPQLETNKLIKQFDEIIDSDLTTEDLLTMYERHVISQMMRKQKELDTIIQETEVLGKLKNISDIQKVEQLFALKKRFRNIQNNLTKIKPFEPPKPIDKSIDTNLIRKFKTAIQDDNYNLDKVYIDYYSDLNGIKKVEQLPNKYPKLKVPQKAEDVIAEKVIATFTRDFYEKLDKLMIPHNEEKVFNFCNKKIMDTLAISTKEPEKVYNKAFEAIITHILQKYQSLIKTDSFSTIPEFRKNKTAQITDTDLKLLSVDYDDFVLTVLRKQHLENKKLNEITYTDGNITIPIASLKENYYKFEKTPEKIKAMIKSAKQIQAAKRDYEHFNNEKLKERLNYYTNQEIGNNEDIFNLIVAFDSCNFGEEDKKALIKFLQTLDDVKDGKISEVSAVEYLKKLDIRPKETEKLNEIEKQKVIQTLRLQQKKSAELDFLKSKFDEAMNKLYLHNMSDTAAKCSKYRPDNLETETIENAEFIINLTNPEHIQDKDYIKNKIKTWDTYNYYKTNDSASPIFTKARIFANNDDGSIDVDKAGRYLINSEIVMNFPQSLEYMENKNFIEEIINRAETQEDAVIYLCKYDEYNESDKYTKSHLLNFIDIFNLKDNVEKFIMKNIIENNYTKIDTTSLVELKDNNTVEATISAKAKQEILAKYKFPVCIELMEDFEKALTVIASDKGTAGIKKINRNNKSMEYKMELKIKNHDDRLLASERDYYFDVYSDKGLH